MGSLTFRTGDAIFIDANILIYSVERFPAYYAHLSPLWRAVRTRQIAVHASALMIPETLPIPLRQRNAIVLTAYRRLFRSRRLTLHPVTDPVLHRAAELRAAHNLRTPDAIHAATALLAPRCDLFLTNDDTFRRVPNLPVTLLRDLLATP